MKTHSRGILTRDVTELLNNVVTEILMPQPPKKATSNGEKGGEGSEFLLFRVGKPRPRKDTSDHVK